jgi:hypothetical protein
VPVVRLAGRFDHSVLLEDGLSYASRNTSLVGSPWTSVASAAEVVVMYAVTVGGVRSAVGTLTKAVRPVGGRPAKRAC